MATPDRRSLPWTLRARDAVLSATVWVIARLMRLQSPQFASWVGGFWARKIGPYTSIQRVAMKNLARAFPEKSEAERAVIARGMWDNLGRMAGEFVHLDRIWQYNMWEPAKSRIETTGVTNFIAMRTDGKPALVFTAHLANWELPAIAAAAQGLDSAVLFRAPDNSFFADLLFEARSKVMGNLVAASHVAVFELAAVLDQGKHLGILVDQARRGGPTVEFFGQPCSSNPTIARLARLYECPVHGVRVIRLPKGRFRIQCTPALNLPRDADGKIDVDGSMQMITSVVEGWVREHPDQWTWFYKRWRD
ncbi:lipid A biosynthesis lauroyl acyltransferase [Ancylobacter pratisalsi]|uniref:Lipid A biosynthesis lauroyl acyltransferase n=1 Tax=Ancylobacter pratisalsi TaxID=1745854 RepID=A0A6P1YJX2_9HYPH|nr:lipid A biosynthesis lauroyl acyltransferase [Ancylobacter pratisalsi]QIB32991.1 lipid A biosynthesis lauroyl acyltransferase [Ancylobacter pratisalsi]